MPCTSTACCARPGCSRASARSAAASCSTPAPRAPSPSPITRSRTSTCATAPRRPRSRRCSRSSTASSGCSDDDGKRALGLDHARSGELVGDRRGGPLVHLLLLARRRARARLRAHRRHPPQARLRPGRALPRSRRSALPKLASRLAPRQAKLGFRTLMDVISLRHAAGEGLARPPPRRSRRTGRSSSARAPTCCPPAPCSHRVQVAGTPAPLRLAARSPAAAPSPATRRPLASVQGASGACGTRPSCIYGLEQSSACFPPHPTRLGASRWGPLAPPPGSAPPFPRCARTGVAFRRSPASNRSKRWLRGITALFHILRPITTTAFTHVRVRR